MNNMFALLGAKPAFDSMLPVGQLYFPSWDRYEKAMKGIFERHYYTNQGPLTQELEAKLQDYLEVKHAICVTNATIGLMMAAEALELSGKVIVPSFTFIASVQSLSWAGLEPVFCDVDSDSHQMVIDKLDELVDENVTAIMGVNLWGDVCDPVALEQYAKEKGLKLYFDSAQAFGCEVGGTKVANFGELEVFSFHATKILSATEGGCICTNDDAIAARLRNIRSSYGAGKAVSVVKTSNGRMSEAQAAIGLMSLEDFPLNQKRNMQLFQVYKENLSHIQGLKLVEPSGVSFSNYQYIVCEIDEKAFGLSRDVLITVLKAENINARRYFYPGVHDTIGYKESFLVTGRDLPVTNKLCKSCLQLPIGAMVDKDAVVLICKIIQQSQTNAAALHDELLKSNMAIINVCKRDGISF